MRFMVCAIISIWPSSSFTLSLQSRLMVEIKFNGPCPFCGELIEDTEIDPCFLTVTTKEGRWQKWWCHAQCFKSKIVENPFVDLSPAHL